MHPWPPLTSEELAVMAGGSTNTKKIEMSLAEELVPKSQEPSREQVLIAGEEPLKWTFP